MTQQDLSKLTIQELEMMKTAYSKEIEKRRKECTHPHQFVTINDVSVKFENEYDFMGSTPRQVKVSVPYIITTVGVCQSCMKEITKVSRNA